MGGTLSQNNKFQVDFEHYYQLKSWFRAIGQAVKWTFIAKIKLLNWSAFYIHRPTLLYFSSRRMLTPVANCLFKKKYVLGWYSRKSLA